VNGDTDHSPVVSKVRERLGLCKQTMHRVHMERFNLNKLNEVEGKGQNQVKISNRFATVENLASDVNIKTVWGAIGENIKISVKEILDYYELKKHKPWFDRGCSKLVDQRKQTELQCLQDSSHINRGNLNNIIHETNRHFRIKKREYLKDKHN
jgi:hypothetical protein